MISRARDGKPAVGRDIYSEDGMKLWMAFVLAVGLLALVLGLQARERMDHFDILKPAAAGETWDIEGTLP